MQNVLTDPKQQQASRPVKENVLCNRCHTNGCERIPRDLMTKFLFAWFKLKRYRCYRCMHTFYKVDRNTGNN